MSRSISRLEERLGAQLFKRTTRLVRLTEAGDAFNERCRNALAEIADATQALGGEKRETGGLVRLSVPTTYAYARVLPALPLFMEAYPQIKLEIEISGRDIDFAEDSCDLAIRQGRPTHSRLGARRLELASIGVFGSRDYLARRGVPRTLEDLRDHDCIGYMRPSGGRHTAWYFDIEGNDVERRPESRVDVREDPLAMVHLAIAGGGLVQTFHYVVDDEVDRGRLVEVLPEFRGLPRLYTLLYRGNGHLPERVRVLIDFLVEEFGS